MSGVCGEWAIDGETPDLGPVLSGLERRGPDRTGRWSSGSVALGHTLLATTPEAVVETLPLTHPKSGCTITADVRLDNRAELIAALGRQGSDAIGDGELILLAYLKWGDDCPSHLLGDFAFAIWDPRAERLFCARDHMGMRQLIYSHTAGRLFAFATEADALVAHQRVPKQINQGRIADYLDGLEGVDLHSTFFQGVFRLPPAHVLSASREGLTLRRYWELQPGTKLRLSSDQEYADAMLKIFSEAVQCRLRSVRPIGVMLSGGLDSNSIAAVASAQLAASAHVPLRTFSAIEPEATACSESEAVRLAVQSPLFSPTLIHRDNTHQWMPDVKPTTKDCAEPFDAYLVISKTIYGAARRQGVNVVLDGVGADVVFTAGNQVARLLSTGKLRAAAKEARLEKVFWGPSWPTGQKFISSAWAALAPSWMRVARRQLAWWVADVGMRLGLGGVSRGLAAKVNLTERRRHFRRHLPKGRSYDAGYRAQSIQHPHLVVARERYDRVAAAFGIEPRDPFMDIRLIQFALSLPPGQLQADGWPKAILRRAMAGKVPRAIAWRRGKSHVGWAFMTELVSHWGLRGPPRSNAHLLERLIGRALRPGMTTGEKSPARLKLAILSHWLDRNTNGPPTLSGTLANKQPKPASTGN